MEIGKLRDSEFEKLLGSKGARWSIGAFTVELKTNIPQLSKPLRSLYQYHRTPSTDFSDIPVRVEEKKLRIRRFMRRQAHFYFAGSEPFFPFPHSHALPLFEWGLNWCIATEMNGFLLLHAAVLGWRGNGIILPAPPGSGKSTLAASLMANGWRLLSDEFAIIDPKTGLLWPVVKPLNLKETTINIIRERVPDAFMSEPLLTHKGRIALMRPTTESVIDMDKPVMPRWVVGPRFRPGGRFNKARLSRGDTFRLLLANSFNYHILGETGFHALVDLVGQVDGWAVEHDNLDECLDQIHLMTNCH